MLCSSYSGNTEETLAAYDAAGEAGAPRVVSSSGGELAARARRDKVPVIPLPGGFQPRAAVGYSFVVALEVAAVAGCAPSLRPEIEATVPFARSLAEEWGPDGDEDGEAKRLARALHETVPVIAGRGARRRGGLPLEVPAERERQAPGVRRRAARGRPQRDRRVVRGERRSRASPPSSSRTRAPASGCGADRADRRDRRRPGGRRRARHAARRDASAAARLARPAGRPRLALPRGAARHRPDRRRADRPPQGGAGGALSVRLRSVVTAHASAVAAHAATIAARGPSALTSWPPSAAPAAEPAP